MRAFLVCLLGFALSSCATSSSNVEPTGSLVFSVRTTKGAFFGEVKEKTGVFFHKGDHDLISAQRFSRGKRVEVYGNSSDSRKLLMELDKIGFEAFDFDEEVGRITQILAEKNKKDGTTLLAPFTLDGVELEIRFSHGSVKFSLTRWNPNVQIEFYAAYSPKIAKLRDVIDLFARYYGKSAFLLF